MKTILDMQQTLEGLGIQTDVESTGDPKWKRMFLTYNGIRIGRISFVNGKPNSLKIYGTSSPVTAAVRAVFRYQIRLDNADQAVEKLTATARLHAERIDKLEAELEAELAEAKRSKLLSWWGK